MDLETGEFFWNCGEKCYVLNKIEWAALRETEYWIEHPMLSHWIDKGIGFTEKHENFICAMTKYPMKNKRDAWVPHLFYILEGGLQRVQLETTECTSCDWRGTIANPTLPDLYIALKDGLEIMRKCTQLKQVTCPICNGKLKRYAIWVET